MVYDHFEDKITQKHGVVVENWPLKDFCNPSSVSSRIELETLYNAWQSGATRFRKFTQEEMTVWEDQRFQSRLAMMNVAPPKPNNALPSSPALPLLAPPSMPGHPQPSTTLHPVHDSAVGDIPRPTLVTSLPPQQNPDPEEIANMIRHNPTLQNIDPALLAIGITQEHQCSAAVIMSTAANPNPPRQTKRKSEVFQVVTPQSYGTQAKRLRREKPSKQTSSGRGSENVVPNGETLS